MITHSIHIGQNLVHLHDGIDYDDMADFVEQAHPLAVQRARDLAEANHSAYTVHPESNGSGVLLFQGAIAVHPRKVVFPIQAPRLL